MSDDLEPRPRVEELQAELWGVVEALRSGRMTSAEANAITREARTELRTVEAALRARRHVMRLGA